MASRETCFKHIQKKVLYNEKTGLSQRKRQVEGRSLLQPGYLVNNTQINFGFVWHKFAQAHHIQKNCNYTKQDFITGAYLWILKNILVQLFKRISRASVGTNSQSLMLFLACENSSKNTSGTSNQTVPSSFSGTLCSPTKWDSANEEKPFFYFCMQSFSSFFFLQSFSSILVKVHEKFDHFDLQVWFLSLKKINFKWK